MIHNYFGRGKKSSFFMLAISFKMLTYFNFLNRLVEPRKPEISHILLFSKLAQRGSDEI